MSGHSMDKKRMMKPLNNAARERSRVQSLRAAFLDLQRSLPSVPPDTKLSKLDVLVLATGYIFHLTQTLDRLGHDSNDDNNHVNFLVNSCTNRQHYSVRTSSTTATPTSDVFPSPQMGGINKSQTIDIIPHPESSLYTKLSEVTHDRAKGAEIVMETRRWKEMRPPNFIPSFVQTKTTTAAATARSSLELPDQGHGTFVHPSPREFEWIRTRNRSHVRPKLMTNRTGSVGILHPVKKWPMRYRLYDKILGQQPTLSMTAAAADVCRL